ncbi:hypothetical protein SPHINGO391_520166 [Sphingomonas aurantiaca]|uniref:Uncharacterized protein n=1 Tax=Sphingomonas aurantiaca TaxID=185949 RepID=A0A5E8AJ46_9SPHN|nr:hypothetical protein SPHINGO391_520166 [Sphingomonas aurantiaca]
MTLAVLGADGVDGDLYRKTGPQNLACLGTCLDADPDGHALHDLGEVARRILRRQHRELSPSSGRKAGNPTTQLGCIQRVHLDRDRLSDAHQRDLRLLEIGTDVELIGWNDRHQPGRRLDELAGACRLVRDDAIDAAADLDRTKVRRGACELRACGITLRECLTDPCVLGREAATSSQRGGTLRAQVREGPVSFQHQARHALPGFSAGLSEWLVAADFVRGSVGCGLGARDLGVRLFDRRTLLIERSPRSADTGVRGGELSLRLRNVGAVIPRVQHRQQLAAPDRLVVAHQHALDIPAELRGNCHEVRANIGVVGRLKILAALAIVPVPERRRDDTDDQRSDEHIADDRKPCQQGRLFLGLIVIVRARRILFRALPLRALTLMIVGRSVFVSH